jgi:formate/nitrite transporter FocA (FNT family)
VLLANLVGGFIFATIVAQTNIFPSQITSALVSVAVDQMRGEFGLVVLRGMFAGWLVALMVWLLPGAETQRLWVIMLLSYFIALGGFAHIIAGSIDVLYLVSRGDVGWGSFLWQFLTPTLLGNIIGGVSLVAALNYAQVAAERFAPNDARSGKTQ